LKEQTRKIGEYTKWSRATPAQVDFFREVGKDVSFDTEDLDAHIEAYATDDGIIIGRIVPLDEWQAERQAAQEAEEDGLVKKLASFCRFGDLTGTAGAKENS
jgi:hypothetical protein